MKTPFHSDHEESWALIQVADVKWPMRHKIFIYLFIFSLFDGIIFTKEFEKS